MTGITVFVDGAIAAIICDAGEEGDEGELRFIGSKIIRLPALSLAIGYEGRVGVEWLQYHLDQVAPQTQAEALRALPDISRKIVAGAMVDDPGAFDPERHGNRLYAIVWRPDVGAAAFMVTSDTTGIRMPIQPFTVTPLITRGYSNCPAPSQQQLVGAGHELPQIAWRVLQEQRLQPWPDGSVGVRGFGELVTVGPNGVQSEIVGRWPEDWKLLRPDPGLDRNSAAFVARVARYRAAGAV